jgi:cell division protein FtsB
MKSHRALERGAVHRSIIAIVGLFVLVVILGIFGVWSYINYLDQKKDVDSKVSDAAAKARLEQSDKDEAAFEERENKDTRQFVGPSDYGKLTFDYPKKWSAYQATDVSEGGGATYEAYLNPDLVPPLNDSQKFAMRVTIEQVTYDKAVASYNSLIKKGDLKSSVYDDGKHTGTMLTGNFNEDIIGTAVLIKMRDRTLTLRTDGDIFKDLFLTILKTVNFNE